MVRNKFSKSKKTTLGVEITSSQIKLVAADASVQPAKILDFALVDILSPHPDNIAQQLKAIVKGKKFKTREANIAISHPSIIHRLTTLPPMPEEEMEMIISRGVNQAKHFPEEPVFDWLINREVEEEGVEKKEILFAIAPSDEVYQKISLVESAGLNCNLLTTIPLILLNSIKLIPDGEQGAIALLHLGKDRGYLIFARQGRYVISREFSQEEGFNEQQVLSEVKRSFHYFKKQFRGEEPNRIKINVEGDEDLHLIKESLRRNLAVEVEELDPTYGLDLTLVKGRIKDWENHFPGLAIALNLALQYPDDDVIDLIPPQVKERKREFKRKVMLRVAAAVILLGLIVSYGKLHLRLSAQNKILRQNETSLENLQPIIKETQLLENRRIWNNKSLAFLEDLNTKQTHWVKALQQLSLIVPDKMVFQSLEAKRVGDEWQIVIKGEITAPDSFTLQKSFNLFYSPIKSSTIFYQVELMPMNIIQIEEKEDERTSRGRRSRKKDEPEVFDPSADKVHSFFEIRFRIKVGNEDISSR